MPSSVEQLKALAAATTAAGWEPPPDLPPASDVLPFLDSDDRNVRVAALRVLAWCDGPDAVAGILRGLDDPKRRVREVAAKSSPRHLEDPRIVERLQRAVEEDPRAAGRPALEILGGMYHAPYGLLALEPVAGALAALMEQPKHRQRVLLALVRAHRLTPDLVALLRTLVREGTKDEAVAATRRLDGFRVAHSAELIGSSEARRTADRAWGDVWYWVRAEDSAVPA